MGISSTHRKGQYFQFPLCALAYGRSWQERLDGIIHYGIAEAGKVLWQRLKPADQNAYLRSWRQRSRVPSDFEIDNVEHLAFMCGAEIIGVQLVSMKSVRAGYEALHRFRADFGRRFGPDAEVRLRSSFLFEARDGKGMTFRALSVLAAIYSVIGSKLGPVRITQDVIRVRALGYKSKRVFEAAFQERTDGAQLLSAWKLRATLDKLTARKLFARATYGRRLTYYSHRMNRDRLREAIIGKKMAPDLARMTRRLEDEEMTNVIRNQRAAMQDKPPPVPNAGPIVLPGKPPVEEIPF